MMQAIVAIIQLITLFFTHKMEKDKNKREEIEILRKEIRDAFAEKDKKAKASRINAVVGRVNRLRK